MIPSCRGENRRNETGKIVTKRPVANRLARSSGRWVNTVVRG